MRQKTSKIFLEPVIQFLTGGELEFPDQPRPGVAAHRPPPGAQQRDIAASLGITERSACGIVTGLTTASCVIKQNDGRPTAARSRRTSRCPNPPARNPPSAKSWPSSRAPARDCS
jgi:hypothetical protein